MDIKGAIDIDDYDDLLGKRVIATVIVKEASGDYEARNKVTSYRPIPKRPTRRVVEETEDEGEAEEAPAKTSRALPGEKPKKAAAKPAAEAASNLDEDDDF